MMRAEAYIRSTFTHNIQPLVVVWASAAGVVSTMVYTAYLVAISPSDSGLVSFHHLCHISQYIPKNAKKYNLR